jgi:hypothetical protein
MRGFPKGIVIAVNLSPAFAGIGLSLAGRRAP